jgi:predicted nucleic acid-binding protein
VTIVDTCFLVDLMKGDPGAEEMAQSRKNLKTTSVTSAEFRFGARQSGNKKVFGNCRRNSSGFFRCFLSMLNLR